MMMLCKQEAGERSECGGTKHGGDKPTDEAG